MEISRSSVLIPIDIQKGFQESKYGKRNNPDLEKNVSLILRKWRENNGTVIHVRHDSMSQSSPLKNGKPGFEFMDAAKPLQDETVLVKHVHSAFIGTGLLDLLKYMSASEVYFCGIATDHCVSTSVRMASDYGLKVSLFHDACAAFDREFPEGRRISASEIHDSAIASLRSEFCQVLSVEDVI